MRCFFRRLLNRFHFLFTRRVVERADSDGLAESNVLGGLKGGLFFQVRLSQLHFHCFHIPSTFALFLRIWQVEHFVRARLKQRAFGRFVKKQKRRENVGAGEEGESSVAVRRHTPVGV